MVDPAGIEPASSGDDPDEVTIAFTGPKVQSEIIKNSTKMGSFFHHPNQPVKTSLIWIFYNEPF
jgi:hypothetical protein